MKNWGISAVAAAVMACAPAAQAAVRYVTGSATFAPPTAIIGVAGQDYANALHVSPRAPTIVDFTFSFEDAALPTPYLDEWQFKVIDMSFKVNGVDLASSADPFTSALFTLAEGDRDTYAFRVQQHAELIPGNPAARYFEFGFDFTLDPGLLSNGLVPTPEQIDARFQGVRADFNVRSGTTGPGDSQIIFAGTQVSLAEAVPEPGTWALMILGFGAVGGALRSRRRDVAIQ